MLTYVVRPLTPQCDARVIRRHVSWRNLGIDEHYSAMALKLETLDRDGEESSVAQCSAVPRSAGVPLYDWNRQSDR